MISASEDRPASSSAVRSPVTRLVLGLLVAVLLIVGFSLYTVHELRALRDEQAALTERNRLDALQIVRIQQNLSNVAGALRDMLEGTEPYPLVAWSNTFERLRVDLEQALARERELAPVGRSPAEQLQLEETNRRFWDVLNRAFALAREGDEGAAAALVRSEAHARHGELVTLVSQLLIRNTRADEAAAARAREVYDRVAREIYLLAAVLAGGVILGGAVLIQTTRRTFDAVQALAADRRALSWRMLKMQEDLQTEFARELHDEFGQILTALGMMLGRIRRKMEAGVGRSGEDGHPSPESGSGSGLSAEAERLIADLSEIQGVAQRTLDRIRTRSRLLHPVILDDFGLQQAVGWYADEFARQHGVETSFEPSGDLGGIPPDVATHLYRIVQEALTNVARHAGASSATVRLGRQGDVIDLSIEDDGRGVQGVPASGSMAGPGGIGITSMRERAALMGGTFTIGARPGGGTVVAVRVPLRIDTGGLRT